MEALDLLTAQFSQLGLSNCCQLMGEQASGVHHKLGFYINQGLPLILCEEGAHRYEKSSSEEIAKWDKQEENLPKAIAFACLGGLTFWSPDHTSSADIKNSLSPGGGILQYPYPQDPFYLTEEHI